MNSFYPDACPDVRTFLMYLVDVKNLSLKTVSEYNIDLRTFFRFMKIKRGTVSDTISFNSIVVNDVSLDLIESVTYNDILEYMVYLRTERGNSAATRARKSCSLRTFYNFMCERSAKIKENPTRLLETPKQKYSLPKYLTYEQSVKLLESVDSHYQERDFCITMLFLNCGLRLSELVGIDIPRINFENNTLTVLGKGNKERIVYLNDNCVKALKDYLAIRNLNVKKIADAKALFISRNNRRISNRTVQWIIERQLKSIGLEGIGFSTHKLRHTAATLMYQNGHVDIRVLKDFLGHANLGTTEIYTHLSAEQLKNASEANPLSDVKIKTKSKTETKNINDVDDIKSGKE